MDNKLLEQCIHSLISQLTEGIRIEIILIDDGSTEDNAKLCDQYGMRYNFIKVMHSPNNGVSVARNIGIDNSSGDYVCFVDPDDRMIEGYIQKAYRYCLTNDADIIIFSFISSVELSSGFVNNNSLKLKKISNDELHSISSEVISISGDKFNFGACWGKLIRRSFIIDNNLEFVPGLKKAQDRVFMFDLYQKKPRAFTYDDVGYIYTIENNESSICHKYNPNIIQILEETQKEFEKRNINDEFYDALNSMNMMFLFEYMQLLFTHPDNPDSKEVKINKLKTLVKREPYKTSLKKVKLTSVRKKCALMIILLRLGMYSKAISLHYD